MKKKHSRASVPPKKGITYGKKRFRLPDPGAIIISLFVAAIAGSLALLANRSSFDRAWYGDLLTTVVCVIGFFALLNIGYVMIEGITVENGVAFLGVDSEKQPIGFQVKDLCGITLQDTDGQTLDPAARHWRNAILLFTLQDGSTRQYRAHYLSRKQYQSILTYFEHRSH